MKRLSSIQVRWFTQSQPVKYRKNGNPFLNPDELSLHYPKLSPSFFHPATHTHTHTHTHPWAHMHTVFTLAVSAGQYTSCSSPQPCSSRLIPPPPLGLIYMSLLPSSWTRLDLFPCYPPLPLWEHLSHYNVIASLLVCHCGTLKMINKCLSAIEKNPDIASEQMENQVRPRSSLEVRCKPTAVLRPGC